MDDEKNMKKKNNNSAAKLRANNRYAKENYDEIKLRVRRGEKEKLMQYAREHGYSLNAFIYDAVNRYRQILDEAISEQSSAAPSSDSAVSSLPPIPFPENDNSYRVVNLFAGMGSMALAFAQAGFNVVRAYEQDHTACEMFRSLFGSKSLVEGDIRDCDIDDIPAPDVLAIGFPEITPEKFVDIHDTERYLDSVFTAVLTIIDHKKPYAVYMELDEDEQIDKINIADMSTDEMFIRSRLSGMKEYFYELFVDKLAELKYKVTINTTHKAYEVSELSQSGRKRYFIALNEEAAPLPYMPPGFPVVRHKPAVEVIRRDQKQNEFFYYRNDISFDRYVISSVHSRHLLYRIHLSKVFGCPDGMCPALNSAMINKRNTLVLLDDFGVRQLTPGEFLMFKGFPKGIQFPKELNMEDRYSLAGSSVNVPVTEGYARSIKKFLDSYKCEDMTKMAEHMTNINERNEQL